MGKGFDRRDFLKGLTGTALSLGLTGRSEAKASLPSSGGGRPPKCPDLPDTLQSYPTINASPGSKKFWNKVSKAFSLSHDFIHMNTGTTGSQPLFSQINLAVYNNYKSADPRDWQSNLNADFPDLFPIQSSILGASALGPRQAAVAAAYGANPDEIVLSYNTTDACNLIFAGTPWQPGDRIITTTMEHNAFIGPIAWARDYHGVEVVVIEIPSNFDSSKTVDEVVGWFETELAKSLPTGGEKQYVVFSEIFYKNGLRMPVKEICTVARAYGAYSIIDSAHAWGMIPVHCHDYGADFIAGAGHKWLCGGPGTGIFYIRNSGDNLPPFAMGNFFLYGDQFTAPSLSYNTRAWNFAGLPTPPSLAVQLRGENNTPALFAMTDSFSFFNHVGIQTIYNRGLALSNYLKRKIENRWGPGALWVQRNSDPAFASFLTSFNPFQAKDDSSQYSNMNGAISSIIATLAAQTPKIYIRSTTWHDSKSDTADNRVGFRISTHAMYNNYDQIDWMFDRLTAAVDATGLPQLS